MTAAAARKQRRQLVMDFDHEPVTQEVIEDLVAEMREVYLQNDNRPWVIGFSGGKDSSCVVQLVYRMLLTVPRRLRTKKVFVLSSDTLVENPAVKAWLVKCQDELQTAARALDLPIEVFMVYPRPQDSFWVCLIGKGYPAPTQDFRWCTGRLKIEPAESHIIQNISPTGRILQLLGSRKKESAARAASIEAHAIEGKFGTSGSLADGISYQPVMDWDNDNVWEYLRMFPVPWNRPNDVVWIPDPFGVRQPHYNNELFDLYQDAHGGECVMEWDRRTASCGGSRFGCWTCTVVPEDRSMTNMVQGVTPQLAPLLAFRQKIIDYRNDWSKRNPIGRNGRLRLNGPARTNAAKAYAETFDNPAIIQAAYEAGARWKERDWYKPSGVGVMTVAGAWADDKAFPEDKDRDSVLEAFKAGSEWSVEAFREGVNTGAVTPGPYLLEVRAELLENLLQIEQHMQQYFPGWTTVTDTDIHWIRHWWEHDGGDPGIVDRLVQQYRRTPA